MSLVADLAVQCSAFEEQLATLKLAEDRAYQQLEINGVPRERARSVSNGIDVLVTRMNNEMKAIDANWQYSHGKWQLQLVASQAREAKLREAIEGYREIGEQLAASKAREQQYQTRIKELSLLLEGAEIPFNLHEQIRYLLREAP
jgi:DNA segregation ATPase FtsK/SpoIIIE-like protein